MSYKSYRDERQKEITERLTKNMAKAAFLVEGEAKSLCLHPRTKVLTNKGWKKLLELKIGDLVTTETGQFSPIQTIIKSKSENWFRLYIAHADNGKGHFRSLSANGYHIVKSSEGWKEVQDLKLGDEVLFLASQCQYCGQLCLFNNRFCSEKCAGSFGYQFNNGSKGFEIGHIKAREFALKRNNNAIQEKFKSWKEENPLLVQAYREKQGRSLANTYQLHPEKHPNFISAQRHLNSSLEAMLEKLLVQANINFIHQFRVNGLWVDFNLPDFKTLLECDGSYWHQDKEKERARDLKLKAEMPDWQIIHLTESEIKYLTPKGLNDYVSSGLGDIKFTGVKINKIEKITNTKYAPYFIDLIIDKGHGTYIANGFLVHNCPVDTGRLRASITSRVETEDSKIVGIVGTSVEYSRDVEFGNFKQSPQPFLYPALEGKKKEIEELLKEK